MSDLARHFFERTLPLQASAEVSRLHGTRGSVAFRVGSAAWTFRFSSDAPVRPGFDRDADLHVWFTEPAFAAFVNGTLDVSDAVAFGDVRARGDLTLLERFGRFLQKGEAALGWEGH